MDEVQPTKSTKKSEILVAIVLVVICVIAAVYIAITFTWTETSSAGQESTGTYASVYTNLSTQAAYDLINVTSNLTVIDCRGLEGCSQCQFGHGHLLGAVLNMNALTLYNETNDILVYSKNGTVGAGFCQELVGHVYGNIYNLEGGYEAWESAKYPTYQI